ncbi:uncharacterized protein LOC105260705 isoform X1 [Felis catus]|uniref:uncharacterized protein LOC105260705 isoform X1 n=1 Tax=Felis catus TaxID=9685 RepID=UPI001D19AD44|nr:uncharacterized protein LOC105260705 isoform X1 [Felis catus]
MRLPTFPAKVRPRRQSGQPAHVSGRRSQEVGTRGALRLFRTDGPTPRGKGYIGGGGLRDPLPLPEFVPAVRRHQPSRGQTRPYFGAQRKRRGVKQGGLPGGLPRRWSCPSLFRFPPHSATCRREQSLVRSSRDTERDIRRWEAVRKKKQRRPLWASASSSAQRRGALRPSDLYLSAADEGAELITVRFCPRHVYGGGSGDHCRHPFPPLSVAVFPSRGNPGAFASFVRLVSFLSFFS